MRALLIIPFLVLSFQLHLQERTFEARQFDNINYLGTSNSLRNIKPNREKEKFDIDCEKSPDKLLPNSKINSNSYDPVVQNDFSKGDEIIILEDFDGIAVVDQPNPDTEGYVGPNHYFQIVKNRFAIWDKTGNLLYGPADNKTIWSDFPGSWHDQIWTDPIVIYDHLNDRWLASAMVHEIDIEYHIMIAVSTTPDPLGEWNCYELWFADMPDYPKWGVWPDGYYLTLNEVDVINYYGYLTGPSIFVFNQEELITGVVDPTVIYFHLDATYQNILEDIASFMPSDLDGNPPPIGTPNYHICVRDDAWGWDQDRLWIWEAVVDWNDTSNCHFSEVAVLETAPFDSNCDTMDYIQQPGGGSNLMSLCQFMMYRQQYRQFDDYQAIVCNHTVKVSETEQAGIRWYELRDYGDGWYIHQESTYAPDEAYRWMGSIAMDKDGNIGLGYSVSSQTVYPSIRITGQKYDGVSGEMNFEETEVISGTGIQFQNPRWGDYSCLTVDPVDDYTFWYTQQYINSSGTFVWQTRINSFQLHKNLNITPDSLIFMTYDECFNGKLLVLKNSSNYNVIVTSIEESGSYTNSQWYADLSNFNFPCTLLIGDSLSFPVYVDFVTQKGIDNLLVDFMTIESDYRNYDIPVCLNEDLIISSLETQKLFSDRINIYPNPFNSSIIIKMELEKLSSVSVLVLDARQNVVSVILNKCDLPSGTQQITWDGKNESGAQLASGVYFIKVIIDGIEIMKKVIRE